MAFISNIKLNKSPTEAYTSGEHLLGVVEVTLPEANLIRGSFKIFNFYHKILNINGIFLAITLKIRGVAACVWTEVSMFNDSTTYFGRENYINHIIYLAGSEDGKSLEFFK